MRPGLLIALRPALALVPLMVAAFLATGCGRSLAEVLDAVEAASREGSAIGAPVVGGSAKVGLAGRGEATTVVFRAERSGYHLVRTFAKDDVLIHVFDARGTCLGSSDDAFDLDAAVVCALAAGETIAVEIAIAPSVESFPEKAQAAVSFAPVDLPIIAAAVGRSFEGAMEAGRPARFAFTAPGDGLILFETSSKGDLDTLLSVRDEAGKILAVNDDRTSDDFSSELAVAVEAGRRYECLVRGVGRNDVGTIFLELSALARVSEDDFPDLASESVEDAIEVSSGARTIRGSWEQWNDADVVDLMFAERGLYRLEVRSSLDSLLVTYDAEGRPLRADDDCGEDNNPRLVVEVQGGERLRARLRPLRDVDRGSWRLMITRVGESLPAPTARNLGASRVLGLAVCAADFPSPRSLSDAITDGWNFRRFLTGSLSARPEDVTVIVDDLDVTEDNVTIPRIRAAIAELAAKAGPDDVVFFAYSGHGDATLGRSSLEPEVRSYDQDLLRRDLDAIRAARVIVLVDACNSGSFVESLAAPNRWVYVSSRADETSNAGVAGEPERTGGSVFLACLFDALMYQSRISGFAEAFQEASAAIAELCDDQHPVAHEPHPLEFER